MSADREALQRIYQNPEKAKEIAAAALGVAVLLEKLPEKFQSLSGLDKYKLIADLQLALLEIEDEAMVAKHAIGLGAPDVLMTIFRKANDARIKANAAVSDCSKVDPLTDGRP